MIGGSFYVLGWLLVVMFTPVYAHRPVASLLIAALYIGLAIVRVVYVPPAEPHTEQRIRWLNLQWVVIQSSAAAWGAVVLWSLLDPMLQPARMALLIGTAGFVTAIAHTYCMRFVPALFAILVMYLPAMVLMWLPGRDHAGAFSLSVFLVYVLSSLIRSHRDYHVRLDADEELRQQRDRFETMSRTDGLTGLANRRHFVESLENGVTQAIVQGAPLVLLVLDVDHFKQINDAHGHSVGDSCLVGFAECMRRIFRGDGVLCARLGGEEFAVLLPGARSAAAHPDAEAFRAALSTAVLVPELPGLTLRVSIGMGAFSAHHRNADRFFGDVDRALYCAKEQGRDRVCAIEAD